MSLRGGYSRDDLEAFGRLLVEALSHVLAGEGGDASLVRARLLEVVTFEEAGRVGAERMEAQVATFVLSSAQLAVGRGEPGPEAADSVRAAVGGWLAGKGPEFVFPLLMAVEELAASRIAGAL